MLTIAKIFSIIFVFMRTRIWNELGQIKCNQFYCIYLLARQKRRLNYFNMITLLFSTAGIMGWGVWKEVPFVACAIISSMQILKLLQVHIIPSDKEIEKLDSVSDFYFDYCNSMEQLWYGQERLSEVELEEEYYEIKKSEKDINKILKDVLKSVNRKLHEKANSETLIYLNTNFNLQKNE